MRITINKQIGRGIYPFTFEGEDLFQCVMESQKLSFGDVANCGICNSDNLRLNAAIRGEKKYKYTEIKCECGAAVTFGKREDDEKVFYLHRDKNTKKLDWKAYNAEETPLKKESSQKEEMDQEQKDYIKLLMGNVVLEQDTKDRLKRFVDADKSSDEAESAIKYTCDLIKEKEGTVPDRDLPF